MKERLLKGLQSEYRPSFYTGSNTAGIHPIGKRVLVLMDEAPDRTSGGILMTEDMVERMSLASESGAIIELGGEAFTHHSDGTVWRGAKPKPGDRVYVEKYAGLLAQGLDGKKYRVMEDGAVGAIFESAPEEGE
jgi:chaperonin GroES